MKSLIKLTSFTGETILVDKYLIQLAQDCEDGTLVAIRVQLTDCCENHTLKVKQSADQIWELIGE